MYVCVCVCVYVKRVTITNRLSANHISIPGDWKHFVSLVPFPVYFLTPWNGNEYSIITIPATITARKTKFTASPLWRHVRRQLDSYVHVLLCLLHFNTKA